MGEGGDIGQSVHSCSYIGWISSRDLMYSMIIAINNTLFYIADLLRVDRFQALTTHTHSVIK